MSLLAEDRDLSRRLLTFATVGLTATATYFILALVLARLGLTVVLASIAAYTVAAAVSYCGHRWLTFRSDRPHAEALPRFAGVTLSGYAVTAIVPVIVVNWLGLPQWMSVAAVCGLVPAISYAGLDRLVWHRR
jgi:putative flippase GtrA